jgi:inner membrane protein
MRLYPGVDIEKLDLQRHLAWLDPSSVQAQDIERFRWFSNDYLALRDNNEIIDVRYSAIPNEIQPLWGIRLDPQAKAPSHVVYFTEREVNAQQTRKLLKMLRGESVDS